MRKLVGTLFFAALLVEFILGGVFDAPLAGELTGRKVLETVQVWFSFNGGGGDNDAE
jgi:hypothetical protein